MIPMTQTYFYDSMQSIVVTWAQRAQNFFWSHNGTQEEMERQGSLGCEYVLSEHDQFLFRIRKIVLKFETLHKLVNLW